MMKDVFRTRKGQKNVSDRGEIRFSFKIRHFCRRIWNIDEFNIIFQEHVSFVNRDVFLVKNTEKTSAIGLERNLLKQDVFLVPCTLVSSLFEETRFFRWSVQGRGLGVRGFWCVYLEVLKSELLLFPVYPSAWLQWLNRLRFPVNKRPQTTLSQISERVFQLPLLISISGRETVSGRDSVSGFSAELRLSRTCDRRTMVEVICATDVGRTRRHRHWLTGRRNEIRLASRNTVTYVPHTFLLKI